MAEYNYLEEDDPILDEISPDYYILIERRNNYPLAIGPLSAEMSQQLADNDEFWFELSEDNWRVVYRMDEAELQDYDENQASEMVRRISLFESRFHWTRERR